MSTKEEIMNYVLHTPENVNPAILSDKLDQYSISSGGGGGILVTVATDDEELEAIVLDKTYNDIESAIIAKTPVYMYTELVGHSLVPIFTAVHDSNGYSVVVSQYIGDETITFTSETADGVLVWYD